MVFAAGLGTRLHPLTRLLPKAVVPVANRPSAWFSLVHLLESGFSDVVINTHHLSHRVREKMEPHVPPKMKVRFIHEPILLGTGGGLKNAWKPASGETFVAVNGDIIFTPNLKAAVDLHQNLHAIATLILREVPDPDVYGSINVDLATHRVCGLLEPLRRDATTTKRYMFTGVHLFHPRAWKDLPDSGCIIRTAYSNWIEKNEVVGAFVDNSVWRDIGTLKGYLDANFSIISGEIKQKGIKIDSNGIISDTSKIGDNTLLDQVVLGDNTRIEAGLKLQRVVVWEGARVDRSVRNAVVTGTSLGTVSVEG